VLTALASSCASGPSLESGAQDAGSGEASACTPYAPPSSFDPTAPRVSFVSDVLPVLTASCGLAGCHASPTASEGDLYLGPDGAAVLANLVDVPSEDLPSMPRVKPGTPGDSFLLYKIDADACSLAGCGGAVCSEAMPQGSPLLAEASRLLVRAWIDQGAVSDLPDAGARDASGD
jgi:hypothetical protein